MIFNLFKKNIENNWMIKFENSSETGYMYLYKSTSGGKYKIVDHMWMMGIHRGKVIYKILSCGLEKFKVRIRDNILYVYLNINTKKIDLDNIININYEKRIKNNSCSYTYSILTNNGQEIIFSSILPHEVSLNKLFKYLKIMYNEISYV